MRRFQTARRKPGDGLIQRHRLPLPPGAPGGAYTPLTGVYALGTLERYPVSVEGLPQGDVLILPAIIR